ncbi:MAG: Sb-PDE family phosphodiesterase [Rhodothalassiaceae bacterium]
MIRFSLAVGLVLGAGLVSLAAAAHPDETRRIEFPALKDGRTVLAIDPHTHSVFSDGHVWPTVRVWEAQRDGLAAYAVTEHLEYQPHKDDIPHPDRDRSYALARETVARGQERAPEDQPLLVIRGSEITRGFPPGHMNAIFITDSNALLKDDVMEVIRIANDQGGFLFWNHPSWTRDFPNGVVEMHPFHENLIEKGWLHGIEVVNGGRYSEEAFQIALDYDLAVIGVSDIHGLVDWDYDVQTGGQRSVTLVATDEISVDAIKAEFVNKRTVAYFDDTLIGREPDVDAIVRASLRLEDRGYRPRRNGGTTVLNATIHNDSPADFLLRRVGDTSFATHGDVIAVPAHGSVDLEIKDVAVREALTLKLQVLNSYIAPSEHLVIDLTP